MPSKIRSPAPGATGDQAGHGYSNRDSHTHQSVANQALVPSPFYGLKVSNWRPADGIGARRGDLTVTFAFGLEIQGCAINNGASGMWVALPSHPSRDKTGRFITDASTGKVRYFGDARWIGRSLGDEFSRAVIAAIEDAFGPDALK